MPRAKHPSAPAQPAVNEELIKQDQREADERRTQLTVIDEKYGGGAVYARERVMEEAKFFIKTASVAAIEVGRRLLLLKEHEGHGRFGPALQELGINPRSAQRWMLIAAKFGEYDRLSHLDSAKLLELTTLDDSDVAALEKGGTVFGLEFDDLDKLSVRELKARLREAEENAAATQKVLDDKNEKLDKLRRELKKLPEIQEWPELCKGLVEEIQKTTHSLLPGLNALSQQVEALHTMITESEPPADALKVTAIQVTSDLHALVNALAPIQKFAYDAFTAELGSTYTSLLTPGEQ